MEKLGLCIGRWPTHMENQEDQRDAHHPIQRLLAGLRYVVAVIVVVVVVVAVVAVVVVVALAAARGGGGGVVAAATST